MGAEVMEIEALETSHVVGKAVRDLDLPSGVLFGALVRFIELLQAMVFTDGLLPHTQIDDIYQPRVQHCRTAAY